MDKFLNIQKPEKKNILDLIHDDENINEYKNEENNIEEDIKENTEENNTEENNKEENNTEENNIQMKIDNKIKEDTKIIKLEEKEYENLQKDFKKIDKRQEDKIKKDELLLRIFKILNYDVTKMSELTSITLQRDLLKGNQITLQILELIPELREVYNSAYLTCLHDNSIYKQKYPVINLVRQILKCNHLLMTPKVISNGYDKASGKKLVTRIFVIEKELF